MRNVNAISVESDIEKAKSDDHLYMVEVFYQNGKADVYRNVSFIYFNDSILSIGCQDGRVYYLRIKHLVSWGVSEDKYGNRTVKAST